MTNDALTRDAAQLEKLLAETGQENEFWEGFEVAGDGAADVDHEIGWAEHEDEWGLLYRRSRFDAHDELLDETTLRLSETPAPLRELIHDLLPLFMEAYATHLENGGDEDAED